MTKVGLVDAHAYSLLAAVEVHIGGMRMNQIYEKLVMLRNPWGIKEWNGDWGDESNKWKEYPEAEKNIRNILAERPHTNSLSQFGDPVARNPNDGCFWMSFKDYMRFFYVTSICYYNENWHNNWVPDI